MEATEEYGISLILYFLQQSNFKKFSTLHVLPEFPFYLLVSYFSCMFFVYLTYENELVYK